MVFASADMQALQVLKSTFTSFSAASGLTINPHKSSFVPFGFSSDQLTAFQQLFDFEMTSLPIHYLGLPLTHGRPDRSAYQPLLDKIQRRLAGWKGRMLSKAGRLTLASSVLSALPSYLMGVFMLPAWLVAAIDKTRRTFLWGSNRSGRNAIALLSWKRVCLPRSAGGLGLNDIKLHNQALLLRWLWRMYNDPTSLWTMITRKLYAGLRRSASPLTWNREGSFFWTDVCSLVPLFQLSTRMQLGNGLTSSFWYDNWSGTPICWLKRGHDAPCKPNITVLDASRSLNYTAPAPRSFQMHLAISALTSFRPSFHQDRISWFWTSTGQFSVSSVYKALAMAGKTTSSLLLWKLQVPPSVRLFLILASQDRLLTCKQLARRNILHEMGCTLCSQHCVEDIIHLFLQCSFITELWDHIRQLTRAPPMAQACNVKDLIFDSFTRMRPSLIFSILLVVTWWATWLERNNRIFRGSSRTKEAVLSWILSEAKAYLRTGIAC